VSCPSMIVHILTEESELPVTRRPSDPESAEIGRECACTVTVFLHWRRLWYQKDHGTRELSYFFQLLPEPDLPFVVCAREKVIAQKSHAGHQTLVTCQGFIDTVVAFVLEGRRVSVGARERKNWSTCVDIPECYEATRSECHKGRVLGYMGRMVETIGRRGNVSSRYLGLNHPSQCRMVESVNLISHVDVLHFHSVHRILQATS